MKLHIILILALIVSILVILYLSSKLWRVREQVAQIIDVLEDMKAGNLNRRILTRSGDITQQICYGINEIAISNQARLIQQQQAEQAYKRLMTSLSHDVKTPLASLIGYLEAVERGLVDGEEKEEYIRVAAEKSQKLKQFVEYLFEWVKLDAGEQVFHFELLDLNELSRNIVAEWIPVLESNGFMYDVSIPETEYVTRIDSSAFTRILNNLLQNAVMHSGGSFIGIGITEADKVFRVSVSDNGKGISEHHLSHIFERMYQGDSSRAGKGNGLGLSITKELVEAHHGSISVSSNSPKGSTFTMTLPKENDPKA